MPSYTYRPPPSGRHYYYEATSPPQHSSLHFSDWQAALPVPENIFLHAYVATPATGQQAYTRSPPMSPQSSERERDSAPYSSQFSLGNSNCRSSGGSGSRSHKKGKEVSRGDDEGQDVGNTNNRQVALRMDSKATHAREQRLVEIRLLLQQLHQQLGPAYTFYCENLDGFETQVSQLKEYADKETLNKIWADKLRAEIKSNEAGTQDRSATKAVYINTITTQVSLCLRHLRTAYEERLPQACASHEQDVIIEAQINIVIGAVEKVLSLASVASTDHHASKNIVASLDRARSLSDTSSELWKALLIGLPATGSCTNESNREDGNQQTMEGGS